MTTEMRVLTVRQPWAWAIIHGGKDVENRVRNLAGDYRGPVAIHVALKDSTDTSAWAVIDPPFHDRAGGHHGTIIGVVDLLGAHRASGSNPGTFDLCSPHAGALCSPWAERDTFHLELANPRPLTVPIEWKGALGLRRLPAETVELIQELKRG